MERRNFLLRLAGMVSLPLIHAQPGLASSAAPIGDIHTPVLSPQSFAGAIHAGLWPELPRYDGTDAPGVYMLNSSANRLVKSLREFREMRPSAVVVASSMNREAVFNARMLNKQLACIRRGEMVFLKTSCHEHLLVAGDQGSLMVLEGKAIPGPKMNRTVVKRFVTARFGERTVTLPQMFVTVGPVRSAAKAQGTTWPVVLVPVALASDWRIDEFYTAATRASSQLVLVGCEDACREIVFRERRQA